MRPCARRWPGERRERAITDNQPGALPPGSPLQNMLRPCCFSMADFIIWLCHSLTCLSFVLGNLYSTPCLAMVFLFDGHSGGGVDGWLRYHSDNHPLSAERSLRPLSLDAPMKLIGPLVGHGWFKLGFVGRGVGACPHEGVNLLTGGRLRPARSGILVVDLALAAASLLACIARHSPWGACEPG